MAFRWVSHRTARAVSVVAACLLLAMCATPPDEASTDVEAPADELTASVEPSPETDPSIMGEGETPASVDGTAEGSSATQSPTAEVEDIEEEVDELAAVPPEIPREPEGLTGLTESHLTEFLGAPSFVRRDGGAQIWQYRNDRCALDLFLYAEGSGTPTKVTHVETRSLNVAPIAAESCYHDLLKTRYAAGSG